jgi:hypothetical protein
VLIPSAIAASSRLQANFRPPSLSAESGCMGLLMTACVTS